MFMDIGFSLIYAVLVTLFFREDLNLTIVLLSVVFGLLPDFDVSVEIFQQGMLKGNGDRFHRTLTHFPILYVPIIPVVFLRYGSFWGVLFSVNIISHFLHDSVGSGWGLKWLWPFSKRSYKIFSHPIHGKLSRNFIVSWGQEELKISIEKYGDKNWIKNLYLTFSNTLILELVVFFTGIGILVSIMLIKGYSF